MISRFVSSNSTLGSAVTDILEHRLQVASVAKESIPLFTYGLIKLAFLCSKTRKMAA